MQSRRMDEVQTYVEALEAERVKMIMFRSELPFSIHLVSQTIESCKGRLSSGLVHQQQQQQQQHACDSSSDETTSDDVDVPVLEFIPVKKFATGSLSESEEFRPSDHKDDNVLGKKSDWLRSAQLWNKSPNLSLESDQELTAPIELVNLVGTCKSLNKEKQEEKNNDLKQTESSSVESKKSDGGCKKEDKEGASERKQRRCWSQDLHRRFLHSLKQLGGAHVATPKQIRELMKVDGLTNDEVKSHLQKYRLHTRRPTPPPSQSKPQAPQFVVVDSIWAPPSDHNTMTFTKTHREGNETSGTSRTRVYTPMTAPPPAQPHPWQEPFNQKPQIKSNNPEGHGDGLARCISPSTSSVFTHNSFPSILKL